MYCLAVYVANARHGDWGVSFTISPQSVRKWTFLPCDGKNSELLRLIGLAYGGIQWIKPLRPVHEDGTRGWRPFFHATEHPLRIEEVTAGHIPYDWKDPENKRAPLSIFITP